MSACYLDRALNKSDSSKKIEVTLIESPEVDVIGVGESTFDSVRKFLAEMGLQESEFLKATDATLKHGIYFKDWQTGNDEYFHPFEFLKLKDDNHIIEHWVNLRSRNRLTPIIADHTGVQFKLAKARLSPKAPGDPDFSGKLPYSYHFDAIKLGQYLRKICVGRGVRHFYDHVAQVNLDESGAIASLQTKKNGLIEGDLFIDCTGFAAVLMRALGNNDYLEYKDSLLCDRAVVGRVHLNEGETFDPRPYTSSIAQENGWIWDIDLYRRRGVGYVYSSQFSDDSRAETVLREYMAGQDFETRFLKMRVGRRHQFWYKNCVAVGLSAGFIEPLESTGIVFIDTGLRFLKDCLSGLDMQPVLAARYNRMMSSIYDETRNFILLHYILSKRSDTEFWNTYRHEVRIPDELQERLELWKHKVPTALDLAQVLSPFVVSSYAYILYGLGWHHQELPGGLRHIDPKHSKHLISRIEDLQKDFLNTSCSHTKIIHHIRSGGVV